MHKPQCLCGSILNLMTAPNIHSIHCIIFRYDSLPTRWGLSYVSIRLLLYLRTVVLKEFSGVYVVPFSIAVETYGFVASTFVFL